MTELYKCIGTIQLTSEWVPVLSTDLLMNSIPEDANLFALCFTQEWQAKVIHDVFKGIGLVQNAAMLSNIRSM
jgi:hypothetical protein